MPFVSAALLLSVQLTLSAGPQQSDLARHLEALVSSERAFSRWSSTHGMRSAFLEFLADDAVIFRPDPVNGKGWFKDRPETPYMLTWEPVFGDVSADGSLGYTTGPWRAESTRDSSAPAGHGYFVSVWKRQGDGGWKVAVDLGTSNPRPGSRPAFRSPVLDPAYVRPISPNSQATDSAELVALDLSSSGASASGLGALLSEDARIYRPGRLPVVERDSVAALLRSEGRTLEIKLLRTVLAPSRDLGYTLGSYVRENLGSQDRPAERGYYLHVWKRKEEGSWRIVLEVVNPLPDRSG